MTVRTSGFWCDSGSGYNECPIWWHMPVFSFVLPSNVSKFSQEEKIKLFECTWKIPVYACVYMVHLVTFINYKIFQNKSGKSSRKNVVMFLSHNGVN
jgi:hypothetical protein